MNFIQTFLIYVFLIVGTINFLHLGIFIIGANVYDIQHLRKRKILKARRIGKSPLLSLVIPAYNEEASIIRCLESIRKNTYRKVEVFVHNDRSTDATAALIRKYIEQHPHMKIRLVSRRKQVGKALGVNYCIKKYAQGELVMSLDADCTLDRYAIKNAVDYFKNPDVIGVAANVKITNEPTVIGLLQQFEHLIGYRSKKFFTVTNCEIIVGGVASTYRTEVLKKVKLYDTDTQTEDIGLSMKIVANSNKQQRIVYGADVLALTDPVHSFKALQIQRYRWKLGMIQNLIKYRYLVGNMNSNYSKSLTLYRLPMAFFSELTLLFEPFILGYVLYLSIIHDTAILFVGAYFTVCLYILMGFWPDEHLSVSDKIAKSFYVPILYFTFHIMDLIQVLAIIKVLRNPKKALRIGYHDSHWTPPARLPVSDVS